MFEYLASVQSAVRRFNDRMKTIADNLGTDNPYLDRYLTKLHVLFTDNFRMKDGVPQIIKPAQIFKDPEKNEDLFNMMEDVPTWKEIRDQYLPSFQTYYEQETFFGRGDQADLFSDFIKTMMTLPQDIVFASEQEVPGAIEILRQKKVKSYEELKRVQELSRKAQRENLTERAQELKYGKPRQISRPRDITGIIKKKK